MDKESLRLELLKLTMRKDRPPVSWVNDARTLEAFVLEDSKTPSKSGKKEKPSTEKKDSDNADLFS